MVDEECVESVQSDTVGFVVDLASKVCVRVHNHIHRRDSPYTQAPSSFCRR